MWVNQLTWGLVIVCSRERQKAEPKSRLEGGKFEAYKLLLLKLHLPWTVPELQWFMVWLFGDPTHSHHFQEIQALPWYTCIIQKWQNCIPNMLTSQCYQLRYEHVREATHFHHFWMTSGMAVMVLSTMQKWSELVWLGHRFVAWGFSLGGFLICKPQNEQGFLSLCSPLVHTIPFSAANTMKYGIKTNGHKIRLN